MRDLFIVASYTIKEMLKRKSFLISNAIILLIIIVGFNVPSMMKGIRGEEKQSGKARVLIIDKDNIFEGRLQELNNMQLEYEFGIINEEISRDVIKEKLQNAELNSCMELTKNDDNIHIDYIIKGAGIATNVPTQLIDVFSNIYTDLQISKMGLTQEQLSTLNANIDMQLVETEENTASGNIFVMMMLALVLFYAIYFCAYQVSSSITTEKTSRIIETLVTSTTPRTIVLGKTLGIGIVGIIQVFVIAIVSFVSANLFLEKELLESLFDLSNITPMLAVITIIYFILGYALYALLYALTGSTVSKPEDINSANSPIAILAVIGFYLAYFSMMDPTSGINFVASIVPISSAFSMPFRMMMGIATWGEIALSIGVLLITILIIASISIRIYSLAILNYGTKMNFKDIFKLYKDKNN